MAELTMDDVLADDRLQQGPGRLAPEIRQIGGREVGPEDGRNPASIGKARVYIGNQPATGFLRQGLKKKRARQRKPASQPLGLPGDQSILEYSPVSARLDEPDAWGLHQPAHATKDRVRTAEERIYR